ncbi:MAG: hypothetical protein Q8S84_09685 [bacterium]|nr:hypothetical protein [bacterium]
MKRPERAPLAPPAPRRKTLSLSSVLLAYILHTQLSAFQLLNGP